MDFITNKYAFHINKLSSNEKSVYNAILNSCKKHQETGFAWLTKDVDMLKVIKALKYDNPYLCNVNFLKGIEFSGTTYKISYLDYDTSEIDAEVDKIIELVKDLDEYGKVFFIHNYLCSLAFYDHKAIDSFDDRNSDPVAFTMYGCLVRKLCVCDGFGQTFSYLLNKLDITNYITIGNLNDLPHCVNAVMINGKWCYIDITCDIKEEKYSFEYRNKTVYPIKHIFFGVSKEELLDAGYESEDLVVETTNEYNYYLNNGWIYDSFPDIRRDINSLCHRKEIINFRYDGKLSVNTLRKRLETVLSGHGILGFKVFILNKKYISIIGGDLYEQKY